MILLDISVRCFPPVCVNIARNFTFNLKSYKRTTSATAIIFSYDCQWLIESIAHISVCLTV